MSSKENFLNYIKSRQDLILLGEYINLSTGISAKCTVCGNTFSRNGGPWRPTPQNLMKGRGCFLCGYKKLALAKRKNLPKIVRQTKSISLLVKRLMLLFQKSKLTIQQKIALLNLNIGIDIQNWQELHPEAE